MNETITIVLERNIITFDIGTYLRHCRNENYLKINNIIVENQYKVLLFISGDDDRDKVRQCTSILYI